jgi:cell division protein FtsL
MIRLAACVWSIVAILAAVIVFQIKYAVQELEVELAEVNSQIVADQEAIHVLRAEWSYLNQPQRISDLAERYLGMDPAVEPQLVSYQDLGDLPLRLEGVVVRPEGAGPLLPREKPASVFVSAPAETAPELAAPAVQPPAAILVSAEPDTRTGGAPQSNTAPRASGHAAGQGGPIDPITATLVKYGGAQ